MSRPDISSVRSSKIEVTISILGKSLDPDAVSAVVGVLPTKFWRTGDLLPNRGPAQNSGWLYRSRLDSMSVGEHIESIRTQIEKVPYALAAYADRTATIQCMFEIGENSPTFNLSVAQLKLLADSKCAIDLDYYVVPA